MTEFVQIKSNIQYPVGERIAENIKHINMMTKAIKNRFLIQPITFWVSGSSGAIIAAIMAKSLKHKSKILYIKKHKESSHQTQEFMEPIFNSLNIIVDDFTRSFSTVHRIVEAMEKVKVTPDCLCVGESIFCSKMGRHMNLFPVIIASRLMISYTNSIKESCTIDIAKSVAISK